MTIQIPLLPYDFFQSNMTARFLSLIESAGPLRPATIEAIFGELKPIKPDKLIGEWDGHILPTGHPFGEVLEDLNWFGNKFDSTENVAPVMVTQNGSRVPLEDWGRASIREVRYKNVVSAALVYDEQPIMVYYRAVKSNMIAGVMEDKSFGPAGKFYFYLQK